MALVKCKECKKEVSHEANVCPHCGVKNPAFGVKQIGFIIVILVAIVFIVPKSCSIDDPAPKAKEVENPTKTAQDIEAEQLACKRDLACWGNKHNIKAGIQCDEHVENLANYSFEWTDGFLEPKFGYFRWLDYSKGWLTYSGDTIKFQNGYGAWLPMRYECDYDPISKTVLAVRAEQGRM